MAGVDDAEVVPLLPDSVEGPVELDAGQAEYRVGALHLQLLHERLAAGHLHRGASVLSADMERISGLGNVRASRSV
jgi:hypothetical protein